MEAFTTLVGLFLTSLHRFFRFPEREGSSDLPASFPRWQRQTSTICFDPRGFNPSS